MIGDPVDPRPTPHKPGDPASNASVSAIEFRIDHPRKLSKELARIMAKPSVSETLPSIGAESVSSTPTEFDAYIRDYIEKTRKLANEAQIKVE